MANDGGYFNEFDARCVPAHDTDQVAATSTLLSKDLYEPFIGLPFNSTCPDAYDERPVPLGLYALSLRSRLHNHTDNRHRF